VRGRNRNECMQHEKIRKNKTLTKNKKTHTQTPRRFVFALDSMQDADEETIYHLLFNRCETFFTIIECSQEPVLLSLMPPAFSFI
jgi:hypothetical protein